MRLVRLAEEDCTWLRDHLQFWLEADAWGGVAKRAATRILAKLITARAKDPGKPGVNAGYLEKTLIDAARGKVVQLVSNPGVYGRVSKQATALGVTTADASVVGAWLARQTWLKEPLTVLTVLNKWSDWLARARATAAPAGIPEGLDGTQDVGRVTAEQRPATTAGRRAPGLG